MWNIPHLFSKFKLFLRLQLGMNTDSSSKQEYPCELSSFSPGSQHTRRDMSGRTVGLSLDDFWQITDIVSGETFLCKKGSDLRGVFKVTQIEFSEKLRVFLEWKYCLSCQQA